MATLREVLATETQAEAFAAGYVVVVREQDFGKPYDLCVCVEGMPPHADHEFDSLEAVEAYIASGEALAGFREFDWSATVE